MAFRGVNRLFRGVKYGIKRFFNRLFRGVKYDI